MPVYDFPAAATVVPPSVLPGSYYDDYLGLAAPYRYPYYGASVAPRVLANSAEYLAAYPRYHSRYAGLPYAAHPWASRALLGHRSLDYLAGYPLDYPFDYHHAHNYPYHYGYPYHNLYDYPTYLSSLRTVQKNDEKKSD